MTKRNIICFDLDGTITQEEILPKLSKEVGLYNEISALTDATINGVIPFKQSFLLRCRLLKEIKIKRVHEIMETICLNEEIVKFINKNPDRCLVVTGNLDVWIKPFQKKILCKFATSSGIKTKNGELDSVSEVLDKGDYIKNLKASGQYSKIISVGDGMGDVGMFEQSDIGIAFGKVHSPIVSLVEVSNYICFNEKTLCNLLNMQL